MTRQLTPVSQRRYRKDLGFDVVSDFSEALFPNSIMDRRYAQPLGLPLRSSTAC